mmetsp:Transcript_111547/g.248973  ORF Transcript_111547/g.248973 Transcript_111547/m.248973 type:complete len:82 (+) Transcript_111547:38-283(+)
MMPTIGTALPLHTPRRAALHAVSQDPQLPPELLDLGAQLLHLSAQICVQAEVLLQQRSLRLAHLSKELLPEVGKHRPQRGL